MLAVLVFLAVAGALGAQTWEARAIDLSRNIQAKHLPYGTVLDPMYTGPASEVLQTYTRCGDSAIWTGHWLAAESFRYGVTHSAEALEAVRLALNGVRLLADATGETRILARCVVPVDDPLAAGPRSEEAHHGEYPTSDGRVWIGNTSRDQYLGVFFGLSVAWQIVPDPDVRARISELVTRLTSRLLEADWAIVMPDGRISTVFWLRPDQEISILQVARQVNPERFTQEYEALRARAFGLNLIMSLEAREVHESYFKFNLNAISFYSLIRLEPADSAYRNGYLTAYSTFRRAVANHGNAFFDVVDLGLTGREQRRDAETAQLMNAFLERPARDFWVDLRGTTPACGEDRACEPIPVSERVNTDFLWQRSPFLLYGGGEGRIEPAGIDFILPYWMGRWHGLAFTSEAELPQARTAEARTAQAQAP